jgi:hypothetical protein
MNPIVRSVFRSCCGVPLDVCPTETATNDKANELLNANKAQNFLKETSRIKADAPKEKGIS